MGKFGQKACFRTYSFEVDLVGTEAAHLIHFLGHFHYLKVCTAASISWNNGMQSY